MKQLTVVLVFFSLLLSACAMHESPTVPGVRQSASYVLSGQSQSFLPNKFAQARGLQLTLKQIDSYIDPSVTGRDREIARRFMAMMPPTSRGDFVYLGPDDHLVSNNVKLLSYVTLTHTSAALSSSTQSHYSTGVRVHASGSPQMHQRA